MPPTLRDRDYRALLDLVGETHAADTLDEWRASLLPALLRLVPADYCSYNEVLDGQAVATEAHPEIDSSFLVAWERYATQNPLIARLARTRDGRPYRFSDVIAQAELRQLDLYRELYGPLGVESQVAFTLPSAPALIIGIALSRGPRDFTDDECALLQLARPHLIQAYRSAQLREQMAHILDTLHEGLDAGGVPVIVVDGGGRVAFASAGAESMVDGLGDGLPLRVGEPLPGVVERAAEQGAGTTVPLADGDALLVRRVGRARGETSLVFLARAATLLSPEILRGLGLTARESDVLGLVARGCSTPQAAQELGLSPRTVEKHLEHIHSRLGVRDRAEAVATAWSAVTAPGPARPGA